MKITYVSSCLLKKNNKILIASRPENKFLSGFWELPGGKLFKNESFETDRKSTRLNSSHMSESRMPSSA